MRVFQVRQKRTGCILWIGTAPDNAAALDAMAHEAGYRDSSKLPAKVRAGGLKVEPLN